MTPTSRGNPRLVSPWRLRNDSFYIVAYRCAHRDNVHKILSPAEASLLPFLDGSLAVEEAERAWLDVHVGAPAWDAEAFADTLRRLEADDLVAYDGAVSPSLVGDRTRFVPDLERHDPTRPYLRRPLRVTVTPTERCVTDCRYCYAERPSVSEVETARWVSLFDELRENEIYLVDIGGGDLLTRSDGLDLLEAMVAREFVFFLSTKNFVSTAAAERLAAMGIGTAGSPLHLARAIQLSIDSADEDVGSSLVGRSGYVAGMLRSVRHLVKAGVTPRVKSVLTSRNVDAPEGVVETFFELGVREFHFVLYGRSAYRHDDALFFPLDQRARLSERVARLRERFPEALLQLQDEGGGAAGPVRKTSEQWQARAICSAGRLSLWIKSNGDVIPCEQFPQSEAFVLGNVFEQGVLGVWNGDPLRSFFFPPDEKLDGSACQDCEHRDSCHRGKGYCYRDSLFAYGDIYEPPPDCPHQTRPAPRHI